MGSGFFDTFQIVGLIFFLCVFVGRTLYLRFARGIQPITLGVGKAGIRRLVEISFFVGLVVWIIEVILYALQLEFRLLPHPLDARLIDSTLAKSVGVILCTGGFGIFVWALMSFGDSWRIGIDERAPGELVTGGAFAVSRNPIFVFLDLYFVGTFLIAGTLTFLAFAAVIVAGVHYQILQEEKFLTKT